MAEADVVDEAAALRPGSPVWRLRRERPEVLAATQGSHDALLLPPHPGAFTHAERALIARRVAELSGGDALAAHYGALAGTGAPDSPRFRAMLRHAEMLATNPDQATRADLDALQEAGLSVAEIVTLSQIVALVSHQARVVAGLRMMASMAEGEA